MQTALRRSLISGRAAARSGASAPVFVTASSSRAWLSTSRCQFADEKKGGLLKSVLYGSDKAKAEAPSVDGEGEGGAQAAGSQGGNRGYSKVLGRGKYIHELYKHRVKPDRVEEYKSLVAQFYDSLAKNPDVDIKLTGSWEVIVGELDTFYHVWEHSGFHGYDEVVPKMAASKEYQDFAARLAPTLVSRSSQLIQEFSFWPSSPPKVLGGIYEMRTYSLKPGSLLEWEQEWRVGLEARKQFVEPIAAFFAQVGELHQVIHMWHYDSMESRKQMRQRAWEIDTWSNTVAKTVKLTDHMSAQILSPLPFSPLR